MTTTLTLQAGTRQLNFGRIFFPVDQGTMSVEVPDFVAKAFAGVAGVTLGTDLSGSTVAQLVAALKDFEGAILLRSYGQSPPVSGIAAAAQAAFATSGALPSASLS